MKKDYEREGKRMLIISSVISFFGWLLFGLFGWAITFPLGVMITRIYYDYN